MSDALPNYEASELQRANHTKCKNCDGVFLSRHCKQFCTKKCWYQFKLKREIVNCANCNKQIEVIPSVAKNRKANEFCCSNECRVLFNVNARIYNWRGGEFYSNTAGHRFTMLVRDDYVTKYIQEHRLIASKEMGRLIRRGEVVIHINRQKDDNHPKNLFVCESLSEYAKRRNGSLPWPIESNLPSLSAKNSQSVTAIRQDGELS